MAPPPLLHSASACHDARQQVSVQLDGELSTFEAIRLRAHLGTCGECRRFRREVQTITVTLRSDELKPPPAFELSRRWSRPRFAGSSAVALAAGCLAAIIFTSGGGTRTSPMTQSIPVPTLMRSVYDHTTHAALADSARSQVGYMRYLR